jgi:choline dehydrogenase-like flavoprotein
MQILWFNGVGPTDEGCAGARVIGAVMRVFSKGEVRLKSSDPHDDPVVEFNLLSDDRDLVRLRGCTRRIIDVLHHPAITRISTSITAFDASIDDLDDDATVDEWLRRTVTDYVHAAGTCRMGQPGDPAAVVDTTAISSATQGLRVCDASVMPDLPKANTHLTTVAIAEHLITRMRSNPG